MKIGDMVNYVGEAFAGPSVCGIIMEVRTTSKTKRGIPCSYPVERCKVFWPTHTIYNWVATKRLERVSE